MKNKNQGGDGKFLNGHTPWNKNKRINLNLIEIEKEHKNGKSLKDISKELGVNDRTIANRLKENNLFIRSKTNPSKQTKQKIKQTMIKKGIQPKERYSGKPTSGCFKKGRKSWNKGKTGLQISTKKGKNFEELYGEKNAQIYKKQIKERRKTQIFPLKDTSIEIKLQNFLKQLKIKFITHKYIEDIKHEYQCDIFIPIQEGIKRKTIIEAFGDYWHNRPYGRKIDIQRANELRDNKYGLFTFWESEIRPMELNDLQMALAK